MNTKRNLSWLLPFVLVIAVSFLVLVSLPTEIGQAAPPAAPTPVANLAEDGVGAYLNVTFQSATALTADTNTTGRQLPGYEYADIQYVIDQTVVSGAANTTTLTIQFSNDNSNWVSGPALVSNNNADGSDIIRVPLFGRYTRINQDVTNSNPVTVTLLGVVK